MDVFEKPFLLCVGAQKSGTSWLAEAVRKGSDIWVSPFKELHWFDRYVEVPGIRGLANKRFFDRLARIAQDPARLRKMKRQRLVELVDRCQICDDMMYLQYIKRYAARHAGGSDFTPEYANLSTEGLQRIAALFPKLHIVFVMRDPAERFWSAARHYARWTGNSAPLETLPELIRFGEMDRIRALCDYPWTIRQIRASGLPHTLLFYEDVFSSNAASDEAVRNVVSRIGGTMTSGEEVSAERVYQGKQKSVPHGWMDEIRAQVSWVYETMAADGIEMPAGWRV